MSKVFSGALFAQKYLQGGQKGAGSYVTRPRDSRIIIHAILNPAIYTAGIASSHHAPYEKEGEKVGVSGQIAGNEVERKNAATSDHG